MIEVKIAETHNFSKVDQGSGWNNQSPNLVRLGLSLAGSSLLLGDRSSESVALDTEGFLLFEKNKKKVSQKVNRFAILALVINLDGTSPNKNTISLFKDGVRICQPQAIPEQLLGKQLFPTISY